jgi:hypothetical protein
MVISILNCAIPSPGSPLSEEPNQTERPEFHSQRCVVKRIASQFNDQWGFIEHAQKHHPYLALLTRPKRHEPKS